jgi:hypothetical protein
MAANKIRARPSKLTPERADRLVALLAGGATITSAAAAVGVEPAHDPAVAGAGIQPQPAQPAAGRARAAAAGRAPRRSRAHGGSGAPG